MKILRIMAAALAVFLGYTLPAVSAPFEAPIRMEMKKAPRPEMHHHHGMSMAMMNDLNLSETQKAKWKALTGQKKSEIEPLRTQINKLQEQERQINQKYEDKIKGILTAEQLKKYESMLIQRREKMKEGRPHPQK